MGIIKNLMVRSVDKNGNWRIFNIFGGVDIIRVKEIITSEDNIKTPIITTFNRTNDNVIDSYPLTDIEGREPLLNWDDLIKLINSLEDISEKDKRSLLTFRIEYAPIEEYSIISFIEDISLDDSTISTIRKYVINKDSFNLQKSIYSNSKMLVEDIIYEFTKDNKIGSVTRYFGENVIPPTDINWIFVVNEIHNSTDIAKRVRSNLLDFHK